MIKKLLILFFIAQELFCINKVELFGQGIVLCGFFACAVHQTRKVKKERQNFKEEKSIVDAVDINDDQAVEDWYKKDPRSNDYNNFLKTPEDLAEDKKLVNQKRQILQERKERFNNRYKPSYEIPIFFWCVGLCGTIGVLCQLKFKSKYR